MDEGMTQSRYEADARRSAKKLLFGILIIIGVLLAAAVVFYAVTYSHPIIIGAFPTEEAQIRCMEYGHRLMGDLFGIPIHAQIISITEPYVYRMISLVPPWKTTVYASENDIPYWEHWK